jgi:SPP1 gp7 family putative phage head morphogenesis protein
LSKPLLPAEKEVLLWQDKSEKAVLKMLEKHYKDALKDIDEKITAMMGRQDANLPNVIRRIEYQRMLKEQLQTALERLHSNEYETISDYLKESYTDAFVGTMYTLHKQDVPIILPVDQSVVVKAVTIDSKLKESLYSSIGKDITQLKKTIAAEITRGIASGLMYNDIARNIRNASSIPMKRAKSIARTEAGRVQEQATFDAAKGAKAKGADVVKQWSAFRDGKTRDAHRKLDGQIRELNEPFEVNGKKAMHPHDFGVAELDINCRCTSLTRARAALDANDLKLMQERSAYHGLLVKDSKAFGKAQAKNIAEFKTKYLKAAETLDTTGKSGIMVVDKNYVSNKGFTIHQDKIHKFFLKPGAKHYQEFYDAGYRNRPGYMTEEAQLLALQINEGYDESKATDRLKQPNGSERFSIYMNLGFGGGKRFRTVWQKDTPDSEPRLITAHRE